MSGINAVPSADGGRLPRGNHWLRWLGFLVVGGAAAAILMLAPSAWQTLIFAVMVLVALSIGLRKVWLENRQRPAAQRLSQPAWMSWLAYSSILASLLLIIWASLEWRPGYQINWYSGLQAFGLGWLMLGLHLAIQRRPATATRGPAIAADLRRIVSERLSEGLRWQPILSGLFLLALMTQANIIQWDTSNIGWLNKLRGMSHHLQILLLLLGGGLMVWGLGGGRAGWQAIRQPGPQAWHGRALIAVMIAAALMRLWNLDAWILRWLDEVLYANAVTRLWDQGSQQILTPFNPLTAFTWVFPYIQSHTAALMGPGLGGLRIVAAGFGLVQVLAVYWLGLLLFGRRVALLAALIIATFPLHLHFSRIGINNIADPVFGVLAMALLVRGLRDGRQMDFALAGAALGLTQYFYEGGRLLFVPFAILWLGWLFLFMRRDQAWKRPSLRNLMVLLLALLSLALPVYYTWGMGNNALTPRLEAMRAPEQREMIGSERNSEDMRRDSFIGQLQMPLRGLIQIRDTSWFYGGSQGFILLPLAPFFLLGLGLCMWRLRSPGGAMLFWWLMAVVFGNALIADPISAPRYLVLVPALALLIALGAVYAWAALVETLSATRIRHIALWPHRNMLAAGLGLTLALVQAVYYFGIHQPNFYMDQFYHDYDTNGLRTVDVEDAMMRAVTLPTNTQAHIVSRNLIWEINMNTLVSFYRREGEVSIRHVFPDDFDDSYLRSLSPFHNHAFFLEPQDGESFQRLVALVPLEREVQFSDSLIPAERQFLLYYTPRLMMLRDPSAYEQDFNE